MDRDGVTRLVPAETIRTAFARRQHVWLDAGYNGHGKGKDWIERTLGWSAEIVAHPPRSKKVWGPGDMPPDQIDCSTYPLPPPGFRVLPRRWVVARDFAWLGQRRRLSKEYELLCSSSEARRCDLRLHEPPDAASADAEVSIYQTVSNLRCQ